MSRDAVTTVDILRHGETEGGEIFRGAADLPLLPQGWLQMHSALQGLHGWQQVISSPLQRCANFADELARQQKLAKTTSHDLREISFGDWDGRLFSDIQQEYGALFDRFWRDPVNNTPPNAEPMVDFCRRVNQAFWQQVETHAGQHLLLVTHGGVVRAILSDVLQAPMASLMRFDVPYACLTRIKIYHDDGRHWPQLVFHNHKHSHNPKHNNPSQNEEAT